MEKHIPAIGHGNVLYMHISQALSRKSLGKGEANALLCGVVLTSSLSQSRYVFYMEEEINCLSHEIKSHSLHSV